MQILICIMKLLMAKYVYETRAHIKIIFEIRLWKEKNKKVRKGKDAVSKEGSNT